MATPPSPEVRKILKDFCSIQEEKYGPEWKTILAKEMAEKSTPFLNALLDARGTKAK